MVFIFGIAFLFGVFAISLHWNIGLIFIITFFSTLIFLFFERWRYKELSLLLFGFLFGALYFHLYFNWKAAHTNLPVGKQVSFTAIISDEPIVSQKTLILTADTQAPLEGRVTILAPPGADIHYGDLISVKGIIKQPDSSGENPALFSPGPIKLASHKGFWLREKMIDLKLTVISNLKDLLPADQAAFLSGILFGSKMNISPDLKAALSLSGTTHLVAVSGYKVTIVIFSAGALFGRFFSRRTTFLFALLFLVLFVLMVGTEASAIRAAIMGFLALVAREIGEEFNIRNALTFTAFFMVLLDPGILTGDLSFVISFASVLGIIYLSPACKRLFGYADEGLFDWKESAITTLSAQLATMPVLVNAFGQFSVTAIPANVFTLSLLPLTMLLGSLLACFGFISGYLAFFTAKLTGLILGYQLFVIRFFAAIAMPLPLPFSSEFAIFFYYLLLIVFAFSYGHAQEI